MSFFSLTSLVSWTSLNSSLSSTRENLWAQTSLSWSHSGQVGVELANKFKLLGPTLALAVRLDIQTFKKENLEINHYLDEKKFWKKKSYIHTQNANGLFQ